MPIALTRGVSPAIPRCELSFIQREPIDYAKAANALAVPDTVIFPAAFPKTRGRIEQRGFSVRFLDISELQKAESGLTCSSLIFEG